MTNTELIQAIKTEIERHLNSATEHQNANPDMPKYRWYLYEGKKELCTDLLDYIDDSPESEKPAQEGLEEEYKNYVESDPVYSKLVNRNAGLSIARHFYELGKQSGGGFEIPADLEKAADDYTKGYYDDCSAAKRAAYHGFIAGYKFHAEHTPLPEDTVLFQKGVAEGKRLMMEEAVETELYWDGDFLAIDLNMAELGYSERDKVRVIVCKKED